jgi:hypothetical protein
VHELIVVLEWVRAGFTDPNDSAKHLEPLHLGSL